MDTVCIDIVQTSSQLHQTTMQV